MALVPSQYGALKAAILADPILAAQPLTGDGASFIAERMNEPSTFVVRRLLVNAYEIGPVLNYVAVASLTTANRDRATTFILLNESFAPTADIESYWDTTFSGALGGQGQATRDALMALWRRFATRVEALYATGVGTTNSPGALVFVGPVTYREVEAARSS